MGKITVGELGEYIREQRNSAQISLRQLAKLAGVSNPYLSQIERGLRRPSAEILQQIAKALRISAEALYVQAGILEEREGEPPPVADSVRADPTLTERQKQVLLEIYGSFQRENETRGADAAQPGTVRPATAASTVAPQPPDGEAARRGSPARQARRAGARGAGRSPGGTERRAG